MTLEGKENIVEVRTLEEVWEKLEEFRVGVTEDAHREWDFAQACEIMRVNPTWFVDERSLELVTIYLFHRPNPSGAFPGTFADQPEIWVEGKIIMDGIFLKHITLN